MIVFDVEIKRAILGRGQDPLPGIEYCEGWRDFAGMGIACLCTYDTITHESRVFTDDNMMEAPGYLASKPTGGFNTLQFDIPLLREHDVHIDANPALHFDALFEVWQALGRRDYGWSLDAICEGTFGLKKSGHGAEAPVWYQQGKLGRVIDYCLRDVWLEAKLINHILAGNRIRSTTGAECLVRPMPGALAPPAIVQQEPPFQATWRNIPEP